LHSRVGKAAVEGKGRVTRPERVLLGLGRLDAEDAEFGIVFLLQLLPEIRLPPTDEAGDDEEVVHADRLAAEHAAEEQVEVGESAPALEVHEEQVAPLGGRASEPLEQAALDYLDFGPSGLQSTCHRIRQLEAIAILLERNRTFKEPVVDEVHGARVSQLGSAERDVLVDFCGRGVVAEHAGEQQVERSIFVAAIGRPPVPAGGGH
jgi:hypothetical protein